LGLQALTPMVGRPEDARRLSGFVDDLDETIRDLRRTIFSLQEPDDAPTGLRGELLRVSAAVAAPLGFEPRMSFSGPVDAGVPEEVRADLLAVLREALTNVVKHARARSVDVEVEVDAAADRVELRVRDDGVGPDPRAAAGNGTVNMLTRARRLGGTCALDRPDDGGALLVWSVPLGIAGGPGAGSRPTG
jgi:signal transduction histidine kinase